MAGVVLEVGGWRRETAMGEIKQLLSQAGTATNHGEWRSHRSGIGGEMNGCSRLASQGSANDAGWEGAVGFPCLMAGHQPNCTSHDPPVDTNEGAERIGTVRP